MADRLGNKAGTASSLSPSSSPNRFWTKCGASLPADAAFLRRMRNAEALSSHGGGRGIRTPERVTPLTVFKTAAFNHSAIPPSSILPDSTTLRILSLRCLSFFHFLGTAVTILSLVGSFATARGLVCGCYGRARAVPSRSRYQRRSASGGRRKCAGKDARSCHEDLPGRPRQSPFGRRLPGAAHPPVREVSKSIVPGRQLAACDMLSGNREMEVSVN